MYENRNYMIFNVAEVSGINFDDVLETSSETLRVSVDGSRSFVKWEGEMPACVSGLTTKEGPYNHSEILAILSTKEWTAPMEEL